MLIFCDDCKHRPRVWGDFNPEINSWSGICMCGWRVLPIHNGTSSSLKCTVVEGKFNSPTIRQDCDECRDYEYEYDGSRPTRFQRILRD